MRQSTYRLLRRRLYFQPASRGRYGRQGVGGLRLRRGAPGAGARRTCTAAGATPVLLEECQVGQGTAAHCLRHPRLLLETLGYHNYGDPWREQRYWGD